MSLDFPTITVLGFLLCIGIAVGFSLLLVVLRGQPVLRLWTASLWLLTLGVTLLALRPYLPLAPAILAGNAAMAGCAVLMLRGVALHLEQPLPLWRPLLMAAAFMACIFAFLVLWPDLGVRLQVFSVFTLLVDGWIAWLLLRHATRSSHRPAAVWRRRCSWPRRPCTRCACSCRWHPMPARTSCAPVHRCSSPTLPA
nr:hypothetical protein [Stenotrophomonas geniculata]